MDPIYASLFPCVVSSQGDHGNKARVVITTSSIHVFVDSAQGPAERVYPFDPSTLPAEYPRAEFTLQTLDPATPTITVTPSSGCGCGSQVKSMQLPQQVQLAWPTPTPQPTLAPRPLHFPHESAASSHPHGSR